MSQCHSALCNQNLLARIFWQFQVVETSVARRQHVIRLSVSTNHAFDNRQFWFQCRESSHRQIGCSCGKFQEISLSLLVERHHQFNEPLNWLATQCVACELNVVFNLRSLFPKLLFSTEQLEKLWHRKRLQSTQIQHPTESLMHRLYLYLRGVHQEVLGKLLHIFVNILNIEIHICSIVNQIHVPEAKGEICTFNFLIQRLEFGFALLCIQSSI
mmetsp:Transcript_1724/g.6043  ORF Transcript_1724/g.6043 Transcript_1724/m.6043 type:complete len:214 (-) Transcript_1724:3996-4637(-)